MTHWKETQISRLSELILLQNKGEVKILYWNSDSKSLPCNGGFDKTPVYPGLIQEHLTRGFKICNPGCFHATSSPHKWEGQRVWMVALYAPFQTEGDKSASLKREIIGEILPEEAIFDGSLAYRLGVKELSGANLVGANFSFADLSGINFRNANLSYANFYGASLKGADLNYANLNGAIFEGNNPFSGILK